MYDLMKKILQAAAGRQAEKFNKIKGFHLLSKKKGDSSILGEIQHGSFFSLYRKSKLSRCSCLSAGSNPFTCHDLACFFIDQGNIYQIFS